MRAAFLAGLLALAPSAIGQTVDQSLDATGNAASVWVGLGTLAQTFTVGRSGYLTRFDVAVWGSGAGPVEVSLRELLSGLPSKSDSLFSTSVPAEVVQNVYPAMLRVDLPSPLRVEAGQQFALVSQGTSGPSGYYTWAGKNSNAYAGGSCYTLEGAISWTGEDNRHWESLGSRDLGFRTFVLSPPPEVDIDTFSSTQSGTATVLRHDTPAQPSDPSSAILSEQGVASAIGHARFQMIRADDAPGGPTTGGTATVTINPEEGLATAVVSGDARLSWALAWASSSPATPLNLDLREQKAFALKYLNAQADFEAEVQLQNVDGSGQMTAGSKCLFHIPAGSGTVYVPLAQITGDPTGIPGLTPPVSLASVDGISLVLSSDTTAAGLSLDRVFFTSAVPEPGVVAPLALAGWGLARRRRAGYRTPAAQRRQK